MKAMDYRKAFLKNELMQLATSTKIFKDMDAIEAYYKELLHKEVKKKKITISLKIDHNSFCSLLYSFIVSWFIRKSELNHSFTDTVHEFIEIIHNSYIDETLFAKEFLEHEYIFTSTRNGFANIAFYLLPSTKESKEILDNHMMRLKYLQYFIDAENGYFSLFINNELFYVHNFADTYMVVNFKIFDIEADDERQYIVCPTIYCSDIDRILIKPLLEKVNDVHLHSIYLLRSLEDKD